MITLSMDVIERNSIPEPNSGCWIWTGAGDSKRGYGSVSLNGKTWRAHRYACAASGRDPTGKLVCHKCDNPPCVNPDHLFLGDQIDNVNDMWAKGRGVKSLGEKHGKTTLTNDQVAEIKSTPMSFGRAGKRYGVSASTIYAIKHGLTWSHIEAAPSTPHDELVMRCARDLYHRCNPGFRWEACRLKEDWIGHAEALISEVKITIGVSNDHAHR